MRAVELWKIDLNLLVVLDVLLREQSVARTARHLNLTPSAVSHALRRLRDLFDNELLVRDGRRMIPTARAEGLAETLPVVLQQLARTLADPEPFDPATSTRTFRLAAPDFIAPLVPLLLRATGSEAPGVRIELTPFSPSGARDVSEGRYDALIAPNAFRQDGLRCDRMGAWPWAVYGRADHPAFVDWSLEAWAAYPHLQIRTASPGGEGPIDKQTSLLGIHRVIAAVVPHFSMAAPALAATDLLLTVPSIAMSSSAVAYQLERREVPFDLPPLELALFRSATGGDEPGVRWFLERVEAACRLLEER